MSLLRTLDYIVSQLRIGISGFLRESKPLQQRYPQYQIGRGSYGPVKIHTFGDSATLKMGAFCAIGPEVAILLGGEHKTRSISMYPFDKLFSPSRNDLPRSHFSKGDVEIGNDVWVGRGTVILSGVKIGDGAVVGAGTVVARDVPPYAVVVGNPMKILKHRFSEEIVSSLLEICWWDWDDKDIDSARPLLLGDDMDAFFAFAKRVGSRSPT